VYPAVGPLHLRSWRHSLRRTGWALTAFGVAFALVAVFARGASADSPRRHRSTTAPRPQRLLVLSLPATAWADLDPAIAPHLVQLLDHSAVADLATRGANGLAQFGDGYATLGAGTRSATDGVTDGEAFGVDEQFGDGTASDAFRLRTGRTVRRALVHLGLAGLVSKNAGLLFDAKAGALGDALARAGFGRAVIANADGVEPYTPPLPRYRRDAVIGLMGSDGTVPAGAVGPELLQPDQAAPFGLRLSPDAVEQEFRTVWKPRSVVLVEGSDLERADAYKVFASSEEWSRLRRQALAWTDAMVGRLLAGFDSSRDAVVVVGPSHPAKTDALTVAAVKAPGVKPGLLQSGTTRRAGFGALVDVAPTILDTLGVKPPTSMEGRPLAVQTSGGSAAHRRTTLIEANTNALFRDSLVTEATYVYIVATVVLAVAFMVGGRVKALRVWLRLVALALIGYLIATYLAGPLHFAGHGGIVAFWCFVIGTAIAIGVFCELVGRRSVLDPLVLALGGLLILHVADLLTGARAEFNSVFGNSATVGIRFAGLGNLSSAQITAAAIALAGLLAWRVGGTRGVRISIAILAIALLVIASPSWGQDFGGTLADAPAFALLGWLLLGRSVGRRFVLALGGLLIGIGVVAGLLDLLRPSGQRSHIGRFFESFGNGSGGFVTVIQRKAGEAFDSLTAYHWVVLILAVVALTAYVWTRMGSPLRVATDRIPTLVPAAIAFGVATALNTVLNDSGITITGMMLGIAGAAVVCISLAFLDETSGTATRRTMDRAPESAPSGDGSDRVPTSTDA
jgi:hypothetical protein